MMFKMVNEENGSSCVKPEKVSLVWAVLHICLASMSSIFYLYEIVTMRLQEGPRELAIYHPPPTVHATTVLRVMSSFIGLMFAAFLYHGLDKKKSSYVKAYFIYGMVNITLAILTTLCYVVYVSMNGSIDFVLVVVVAVFCIIYYLVLVMIRRTYLNFEAEYDQQADKLLEDQNIIIS